MVGSPAMYVVVWEFVAASGKDAEFARVYGHTGVWVELFRRCPGYRGTELLRDGENPARFLTLDTWDSRRHAEDGIVGLGASYRNLDAACEALTASERLIGRFETP